MNWPWFQARPSGPSSQCPERREQKRLRRIRPGHRRRPRRRGGHARADQRTFPAHGIVGEEFPADRPDAEYVWILDPIDGTKSFICGMPAWGTLIALTRYGDPIYGMMHQPFTREQFAGDGSGSRYRGPAGDRVLQTRPCAALSDAIMLTTSPLLMKEADRQCFGRVEQAVRLSRYGGDCYAYCVLAAGHVDLIIETELKPHDVLALIPSSKAPAAS